MNCPFYGYDSIWSSTDMCEGNIHRRHIKYSIPCANLLGFGASRVTSKIIGIGAAESSWGDVKTIKSGNISDV